MLSFSYGSENANDKNLLFLFYYNLKGEKFAMYIALPTKTDGLDELVSRISSSNIQEIEFMQTTIKVSLPKFKISNTIKLNEVLQSVNIIQNF